MPSCSQRPEPATCDPSTQTTLFNNDTISALSQSARSLQPPQRPQRSVDPVPQPPYHGVYGYSTLLLAIVLTVGIRLFQRLGSRLVGFLVIFEIIGLGRFFHRHSRYAGMQNRGLTTWPHIQSRSRERWLLAYFTKLFSEQQGYKLVTLLPVRLHASLISRADRPPGSSPLVSFMTYSLLVTHYDPKKGLRNHTLIVYTAILPFQTRYLSMIRPITDLGLYEAATIFHHIRVSAFDGPKEHPPNVVTVLQNPDLFSTFRVKDGDFYEGRLPKQFAAPRDGGLLLGTNGYHIDQPIFRLKQW